MTLNFDGQLLGAYPFERYSFAPYIATSKSSAPASTHAKSYTPTPPRSTAFLSFFTIATTMHGKWRRVSSVFRWVTGLIRYRSSNLSTRRELCWDWSQVRCCLHRGRPQPDSRSNQVQLFVGRHVSLLSYSSLFLFGTQGGTGLATIPAIPTAKITSSSAALDPTVTLTTPFTPILSKRAGISRTEEKNLGLGWVQRRWISRRSARS